MKSIIIKLALFAMLLNSIVFAKNTVAFNYGQSKDDIDIYRIALQQDFDTRWFETDFGYLSGYCELSLNYWRASNKDTNLGVAFSPVFAYYLNTSGSYTPYIEGGIGASLFLKTHIDRRDLSSAYLFEDRIGVGVLTDDWNIEARYMHYSNANIVQPNDGIDIFILSIGKRF